MFRHGLFGHASGHMPKFPRTDTPLVLAADGSMLDNDGLFAEKRAKYAPLHKAIRAPRPPSSTTMRSAPRTIS